MEEFKHAKKKKIFYTKYLILIDRIMVYLSIKGLFMVRLNLLHSICALFNFLIHQYCTFTKVTVSSKFDVYSDKKIQIIISIDDELTIFHWDNELIIQRENHICLLIPFCRAIHELCVISGIYFLIGLRFLHKQFYQINNSYGQVKKKFFF